MPRGNDFRGGGLNQSIQAVVALGVSTVLAQTRIIGVVPRDMVVKAIRFHAQSAPTATTLTAEVTARPITGGAAVLLQSAVTDIDFATAALALAGVEAALTATPADLNLDENQLLEVDIAVSAATVGPGDLVVEVEFEPRIR